MVILLNALVCAIAFMHIYFLVLEMFLWTKPKGLKIFAQTYEQAKSSAVLAANQGLYNGFLAAGLFWSLLNPAPEFAAQLKVFFLACVLVAGLYGGATVGKKILLVQALPALLALVLLTVCHAMGG